MTRYKTPRKSFIIAAIVILLCLISISGATYALFTNGEDGKIGLNITTGKVKIDIVDDTDSPETLVGDVLDFVTEDEDGLIIFEPGATYHTEGFRIRNDGNIPVHFILYISEDEKYDESFADAFEVWLTNDPSSRSGMVKLNEFEGRLQPGKISDAYYLVFKMKTSAGNEFQNTPFSGVGVTVLAVQGNAVAP